MCTSLRAKISFRYLHNIVWRVRVCGYCLTPGYAKGIPLGKPGATIWAAPLELNAKIDFVSMTLLSCSIISLLLVHLTLNLSPKGEGL